MSPVPAPQPPELILYMSHESQQYMNTLLEEYIMGKTATKKQVISFVRTLGGEARYSGKKKTMYLSGTPFAATKELIMETFSRVPFAIEPK